MGAVMLSDPPDDALAREVALARLERQPHRAGRDHPRRDVRHVVEGNARDAHLVVEIEIVVVHHGERDLVPRAADSRRRGERERLPPHRIERLPLALRAQTRARRGGHHAVRIGAAVDVRRRESASLQNVHVKKHGDAVVVVVAVLQRHLPRDLVQTNARVAAHPVLAQQTPTTPRDHRAREHVHDVGVTLVFYAGVETVNRR
jgi:hypothetical protein